MFFWRGGARVRSLAFPRPLLTTSSSTSSSSSSSLQIAGAFENPTDARRALREIALLRALGPHDNVVAVRDVLWPPEADAWLKSRGKEEEEEEEKEKKSDPKKTGPLDSAQQQPPPSPPAPRFDDVYVLYELMDTDLHQIIRSKQPLTDEHAQFFLYQLLRGLRYVHSGGVLHRDLKPSNLLVNASCDLKIADFGLARAVGAMLSRKKKVGKEGGEGAEYGEGARGEGGNDAAPSSSPSSCSSSSSSSSSNLPARPFLTEYVVTRWYRAPELLLGASDGTKEGYGAAVDVWSAGCILAELLGRRPLFAGRDYIDQLQRIVALLGVKGSTSKSSKSSESERGSKETSTSSSDDDLTLSWVPEGRARAYVAALPRPSSPPEWQSLYPDASAGALDLLPRLLALDPRDRISVDEALAHPWLLPLADPEGEPEVGEAGVRAVEALEGGGAGCGGGGERRGERERRRREKKGAGRKGGGGKEEGAAGGGGAKSSSSSSSSDSEDEGDDEEAGEEDDEEEEDAGERLRLEALVEMMHYPSARGHAERLLRALSGSSSGEQEASSASSAAVEKAASGLAAVSLSADASSSS